MYLPRYLSEAVTGGATFTDQADLSGAGTLTPLATVSAPATGDLSGTGTLDATASAVAAAAAALSGVGTMDALPSQVVLPGAVLDGTGSMVAAAYVVHRISVIMAGEGVLTAADTRGGGGVTTGPCAPWPATWSCALSAEAIAVTGAAVQAATEVLYALSGRRFGLCSVTLRPCRRDCFQDSWLNYWWDFGRVYPLPILFRGSWFNLTCGFCGDNCSCTFLSEAALPGPVHDVESVKVDGVTLTQGTDYRIDDFRLLVRLGGAEWPLCNDLNLADTEVGTWSVTANFGEEVPELGKMAVGQLAAEIAKMLACDDSCALPSPVQSISRQGVNITYLDPNELFKDGQTGLYLPDLFIQTYNPSGNRRRARAYDIDGDQNRRIVGS